MAEFSAESVLKQRWDPAHKGQAIHVLLGVAGLLVAVAVLGWLALRYFRLEREPIALMLAVAGPLLTAGATLTGAAAIQFHAMIGQLLKKTAIPRPESAVKGRFLAE